MTHKSQAELWCKQNQGADYKTIKGVAIAKLEDLPLALAAKETQDALAKLTHREKVLLGLVDEDAVVIQHPSTPAMMGAMQRR